MRLSIVCPRHPYMPDVAGGGPGATQHQAPALGPPVSLLVCRSHLTLMGLPLAVIAEIMRPQPLQPLRAAAPCVQGVARIRGLAVPVVDAGALLGVPAAKHVTRVVTLRVDQRLVGLAVEAVLGVHVLAAAMLADCPPLLAADDAIQAIGTLDAQLLIVLRELCVVDGTIWEALADAGGAS